MIVGFEEAQAEIGEAVARDLHWFAPPERQRYLGEAVLSTFAALMLSAFLAGFKDAAEKKFNEGGKKVFEYLWEAVTDLFSDKGESEARKELEKRACDAPRIAAGLTEEQLARLLTEVEKELKTALQNKLPSEQADKLADKLAGRVRQSVLKHVLSEARKE